MERSAEFMQVRDAILALSDAERKRLWAIVEAAVPLEGRTEALCAAMLLIASLPAPDRLRIARWVRTYVNRWGQVPQASSHAASAAYVRPERES
jgi:hypothetical protein